MMNQFFNFIELFVDFLWGYIGVPTLLFVGIYLSFRSGFIQIRKFPAVLKTFFGFLKMKNDDQGVHPLKAFFACIGGCVGVGNIVGICSAVQIGGPGALFWIWMTALIGATVKYAEVYLGVKHRVSNTEGGYNGGPMYFMQRIFKSRFLPAAVAVLLCIYGVEIYQFSVVAQSLSQNFSISQPLVIVVLLGLVMFAGSGGVNRVGSISSAIVPFFVLLYVGMSFWVLLHHLQEFPAVIKAVFSSAFSGHAALGGFLGSTLLMTISHGVRSGCYSGDLGIGYASVIHAESSTHVPEKQASLVIFDIFLDTFLICTSSVMVILATGVWQDPLPTGMLVQTALGMYFPHMDIFMPVFLFLLGYSTINAYFCVGLKCAEFLSPSYGKKLYYAYAAASLFAFSFAATEQARNIMAIAGGLLMVVNSYGIFKLRNELSFDVESEIEQLCDAQAVNVKA